MSPDILAQINGTSIQFSSVGFAAFGGIAINLLPLMELRTLPKEQWPDFKHIVYWLPFMIWPILGAGLALAYETGTDLNGIVAINIGVSAPLILRAFAESNPFGKQL